MGVAEFEVVSDEWDYVALGLEPGRGWSVCAYQSYIDCPSEKGWTKVAHVYVRKLPENMPFDDVLLLNRTRASMYKMSTTGILSVSRQKD